MQISMQNLSKEYGKKTAVKTVDLELKAGIYGLLGANGAGKSTLMRMLCGVLKPTSGVIQFNGQDISTLGEGYYEHIGYMPQDFGYYPDFTARDFMMYMASVKGLDKNTAKMRTEELLKTVNLHDVASKKIKSFSGGMKQRLGIAQAELNSPSILVLDEPTAGLDPKERIRFRNLISDFAKSRIIILSTHIVSDIAYIADTILMMKKGEIIMQSATEKATKTISGKVWELVVDIGELNSYTKVFTVANLQHENNKVRLRIIHETVPSAQAKAVEATLDDLFLYHFGGMDVDGGVSNVV